MKVLNTNLGDEVYGNKNAIIIKFRGKRNCLSTSLLNGGYYEDLLYVFNFDGKEDYTDKYILKESSYKEHLWNVAKKLGLKPEKTTGISTTADMENVSICTKEYDGLSVVAIVTAGVKNNSGRAGDPASYDERSLQDKDKHAGTINIILEIDARLSPGTLTNALITCTEAKTAALQELMIGSNYSNGLATGTGTDGTIIISNLESPIHLSYAGKHSKLGELIGLAVKAAVKESINNEENINSTSQFSFLKRLKRYNITKEGLWEKFSNTNKTSIIKKETFLKKLKILNKNEDIILFTIVISHLLDEFRWELLGEEVIIKKMIDYFKIITDKFDLDGIRINLKQNSNLIDEILNIYKILIIQILMEDLKETL